MVDAGQTVIAGGGGGIPVIQEGNRLKGVNAVIDKDFCSERLAEQVDADLLVILTAVEKVCINFGKENQEALGMFQQKNETICARRSVCSRFNVTKS